MVGPCQQVHLRARCFSSRHEGIAALLTTGAVTAVRASGEFLIEQARLVDTRLVDTNVDGVVIKSKGHWLMEEAPSQVIPQLVAFINKSQ